MTSTTSNNHREALQDRQSARGDRLVADLFRYSCTKTERGEIFGLVETLIVTGKRGKHHIQRMADFLTGSVITDPVPTGESGQKRT